MLCLRLKDNLNDRWSISRGALGPSYYENIVAHLNNGEPLVVTPESARRVVAVMDLAEKSSKTHQAETVPYEFEI
jgi:hypothetical protein